MTLPRRLRPSVVLIVSVLTLAASCGDDDKPASDERDAGSEPEPEPKQDAEVEEEDAGEPDCYAKPESYLEIINACTDAEQVDKDPELPQLLPDGSLPSLP